MIKCSLRFPKVSVKNINYYRQKPGETYIAPIPSANCRNGKHGTIMDQSWQPKVGQCYANVTPKLGPAMALYWAESRYLLRHHVRNRKARVRPISGSLLAGRNLPEYWQPVTGKWRWPSLGRQVQPLDIISVMDQYWRQVSATSLPILGQRWAVFDFALGMLH